MYKIEKNKNKGITLIALIITIIVLLVLAGVSLNAIIGENGIITNSQRAKVLNGMATLEEWLQEEYVKYYDEAEDYYSKQDLLASKMDGLFLKSGSSNYVFYDGKAYYLLNKNSSYLPKEIKDGLVGGDSSEYADYSSLNDVYGISSDLKVFYCEKYLSGVIYGDVEETKINLKVDSNSINNNSNLKSSILSTLNLPEGTNVNLENAYTLGTLEAKNLNSLSGISDLKSLENLTLKNCSLDNLQGLEKCLTLKYIFFDNCYVGNYSKLAELINLNTLYMYLPPDSEDSKRTKESCNDEFSRLSSAMSVATKIKNLENVGIFGKKYITSSYGIELANSMNIEKRKNNEFNKLDEISSVSN